MKMYKILDGCCKAGGCSVGYKLAFQDKVEITGVDIKYQKNYPYEFTQADILYYLNIAGKDFDFIHVSPECKGYTRLMGVKGSGMNNARAKYTNLIPNVRDMLVRLGRPYIIEATKKSELINPIMLCGEMFGLGVLRHRYFETNLNIPQPNHIPHRGTVENGVYCGVYGTGGAMLKNSDKTQRRQGSTKVKDWRVAMGIDWMLKTEISQAIPPAYTNYLGSYVLAYLEAQNVD